MPADRHELPALDRLTADVAQAMRAAERAPRARWWRHLPPLTVTLLALAVPTAIALHATTDEGDAHGALHSPGLTFAAAHCEDGTGLVALVLAAGAAGGAYRCAIPGISRTAGSPTAAVARRSCA
jgi:hypothetical protein